MSHHCQGCQAEEQPKGHVDGRRGRLPVVVERVLQRWGMAVGDVEGGHQGSEADEDNLPPRRLERVVN